MKKTDQQKKEEPVITHKTWATVFFSKGEISIELTLNYEQGTHVISHGSNDQNVTFRGDLETDFTRCELVRRALLYVKDELNPYGK